MSASKRQYEEALDRVPAKPTRGVRPCTKAVCELFDATVIPDMVETSVLPDGPTNFRTVYYIGYRSERAAGLIGGALTICFDSLADVESFCERNWDKFHLLAESMEEDMTVGVDNPYDLIITWR